jgi:hypothetical protein
MAIKTHDTNPQLSSAMIREILALENDIDKHLLQRLIAGKTSYLVTASGKNVVDILIERYRRAGWTVVCAYGSEHLFRLEFEDPDQMEITKRLKAIRPTPITASLGQEMPKADTYSVVFDKKGTKP